MLFNSLEFAIFFPLVVALFFVLPRPGKIPLLLLASCAFYMAFIPAYILILFTTILVDYAAAFYIERSQGRSRTGYLVASIISTCAILAVFKYCNFFLGNVTGIAHWLGWNLPDYALNIILPIGLSFHTFQSLSYVIEVYRGTQPAERNFTVYATYVMFFPQLVAGPIERPQQLLWQFHQSPEFDPARVISGLKRMAWGFFKKVVIADRLAIYVNDVYGRPADYHGLQLTLATVFFAYQIYCDFSGYSDIAIGTARVLGFRLMENFDTPYHSASISEFWRRWHISLSSWFRDYVYIPLGGSRNGAFRNAGNLLFTFGISGLWHGANWTFVLWGLLNGFYLVFGKATRGARNAAFAAIGLGEGHGLRRGIQIATTFCLACFAWVLFRAKSVDDALYVYSNFFSGWDFASVKTEHFFRRDLLMAFGGITLLEFLQWAMRHKSWSQWSRRTPTGLRWAAYVSVVFGVLLFGVYRKTEFIYFQF